MKEIEFRKYKDLGIDPKPLVEGVTPSPDLLHRSKDVCLEICTGNKDCACRRFVGTSTLTDLTTKET